MTGRVDWEEGKKEGRPLRKLLRLEVGGFSTVK